MRAYSCWSVDLPFCPSLTENKAQISPRASAIYCWYVDWKLKQSVEKLGNALIFLLICWFTILPNTDQEWSSNFPGIVRRTPLICWFTILNITAQELKLKFSQCVWHFPVDQLIAQSQCHWPENLKIRYSAQIPVDLLIYQTDHHWPTKKLKFYPEQVKFPVDMLTGN